jgi:hypothetical protein
MATKKGSYNESAARRFAADLFDGQLETSPHNYHIRYDEDHEPIIPGRHGELYVYGPGQIGVYLDRADCKTKPSSALDQAAEDLGIPIQRGDWESVFVVPHSKLPEAAQTIKAFSRARRAPLSEDRKAKLREGALRAQKAAR